MTKNEDSLAFKFYRLAFLEGAVEALKLYTPRKDGEQFVDLLGLPLEEVLLPYQDEIVRLKEETKGDQS